MADPVVRIEPERLVVEPGGQAQLTVTVRNTGTRVEFFTLEVRGRPASWAQIITPEKPRPDGQEGLPVFVGEEATATVVFTAPPGSAATAGQAPFCVLATSTVTANCSAAAEGDLEVGRVDGMTAQLTPVASTGRWSGRHTVKVSNWGNAPAKVALKASDPDEALAFLVHPPTLDLPVGASAVAAVRVRSRRPFLRGAPVRLPFRVVAEPDPPVPPSAGPAVSDPHRPVVDGALNQRPVLSKGTVALGALAVAATVVGVVIGVTAEAVPAQEPKVDDAVSRPAGVQITDKSDTAVTVQWDAFERVPDTVEVFRIDPATRDDRLPVTEEKGEVEGTVNAFPAEGLEPSTEVCFQLVAVRGETQSPRTDPVCDTTAAPPPEESTATSTPPAETTATGTTATETTPGETTASETTPTATTPTDGATDGSGTTDGSTTTPPGSTPGTTPALPDFGEQWVPLWPFPPDSPLKEKRRATLEATGATIGDLSADDYPDLGFLAGFDFLYADMRFDTAEQAKAACDSTFALTNCVARRPGSPG